jgi:hypothetical protein
MDGGLDPADSRRLARLAEKFHDKQYRDSYVASHTRGVLAQQMRNFRGDLSQAEYADKIGKQKTVIGRLQNPGYAGWSLRTMLEIAGKENVAVLVRFVDFPTFLGFTDDLSDESLHPRAYDQGEVDLFAGYQSGQTSYHDPYPSLNINRGMGMGPSIYGDIFFGQSAQLPALNNLAYNPASTSALVNAGSTIQLARGAAIHVGGPFAWPSVFAAGSFLAVLPTPAALARANAEIARLNNVVAAQAQMIFDRAHQQIMPNPQAQVIPFPIAA